MNKKPNKKALAAILAAELVSAVLAWRDMSRRPDSEVRGRKKVWRIVMIANPGNSLAYWVFGRR